MTIVIPGETTGDTPVVDYRVERPIYSSEEDEANFSEYASHIAEALVNSKADETQAHIVSIQGAWGSGKTSLINLIGAHLKEKDPIIIIEHFNPWDYLTEDDITTGLLNTVRAALTGNHKEVIDGLIEAYDAYYEAVQPKILPARLLHAYAIRRSRKERGSLALKKKNLVDKLKFYDCRILLIVDDVDRLPDDQIRRVIRLVAATANFPRITYLLAFDSTVIEKALNDFNSSGGATYLDKIIQDRYAMPAMSRTALMKMLSEGVESVFEEHHIDNYHLDDLRLIFADTGILIRSVRDIKRILRLLEEKILLFGDEIASPDLLGICTVEALYPDVFRWIASNYRRTLDLTQRNRQLLTDQKEETLKSIIAEFDTVVMDQCADRPSERNNLISLVKKLFAQDNHKQPGRLSNIKFADAFFQKTLTALPYSVKTIHQLNTCSDVNELISIYASCNEGGFFQEISQAIRVSINKIDYPRQHVAALLQLAGQLPEQSPGLLFLDGFNVAVHLAIAILRTLSEGVSVQLIQSLITSDSPEALPGLGYLLHIELLAQGRIEGREANPADQIFEDNNLNEICSTFVGQMLEHYQSVLSMTRPYHAFLVWELTDEHSYGNILTPALSDDDGLMAQYALMFVGTSTGSDGDAWGYANTSTVKPDNDILLRSVDSTLSVMFERGEIPPNKLIALHLLLAGHGKDRGWGREEVTEEQVTRYRTENLNGRDNPHQTSACEL